MSKYAVISGPYFLVFGLNTEIYGVALPIQSEYRKIRTRQLSPYLDTFHAVILSQKDLLIQFESESLFYQAAFIWLSLGFNKSQPIYLY